MAQINTGRAVMGGVVAGLVINVVESVMNMFVLVGPTEDMLAALNLDPIGGGAIGGFVVLAFVLGLVTVWVYAAIRPRFGGGPGTAMRAGLVAWALFYLLPVGANWLMGIAPLGLYLITMAYSLPTMLLAAYAGGMVYKEE